MTTSLTAPPGFERTIMRDATIAALDLDAIVAFVRETAPPLADRLEPEQLARQFGLAGAAGRELVPTIVGLYMFGHWPQALRPEWGVAAVRVDGRVLADELVANQALGGSLPLLLDNALAFVDAHTQTLPDQTDQSTAREYPRAALREALTNALVHRDMRMPARVTVTVFDDRLEIWSPGPVQGALDLEIVAQLGGLSVPRNPICASVARTLGLIDQIGRGLPSIRRASQRFGGGDPSFLSDEHGVRVVLPSALAVPAQLSGTQHQ